MSETKPEIELSKEDSPHINETGHAPDKPAPERSDLKPKPHSLLLLAVLGVAVLFALSAGGLMAYRHIKDTAKVASTTQTSQKATNAIPKDTSSYLDIKEWGVRLKLDSATRSMYYYINPSLPNTAYVSLKAVSDIAPGCAAEKISLGAIFRLAIDEEQKALTDPTQGPPGSTNIGNFWYGYLSPQAGCTDGASQDAAIQNALPGFNRTYLVDAFNTIGPIESSASSVSSFVLPDNWTWYNGPGFKFAYPKAYGKFNLVAGTNSGEIDYVSGKPQPAYVEGSTDGFGVSIVNNGTAFSTVKYGPTVKYVSGALIVQDVNPADHTNVAGQPYRGYLQVENVTKYNGDLKIYLINGGDEGNTYHKYSFEIGGKVIIVSMPGFYDGVTMMCPDTGCKANDKTAYETFSTRVLESISKL